MASVFMTDTKEIWKPIPNYPGYEVSNTGKVRSYRKREKGRGWFIADEPQRILSPHKCNGYPFVMLAKNDPQRIHRLVMLAFVGPCPDGMEVCHNDGDPRNNNLDNLRYDTRKENSRDIYFHGKYKLTPNDVALIRKTVNGASNRMDVVRDLAKKLGVSVSTVYLAAVGRTYKLNDGTVPCSTIDNSERNKQIKKLYYTTRMTQAEIAKRFNMSQSGIGVIVNK